MQVYTVIIKCRIIHHFCLCRLQQNTRQRAKVLYKSNTMKTLRLRKGVNRLDPCLYITQTRDIVQMNMCKKIRHFVGDPTSSALTYEKAKKVFLVINPGKWLKGKEYSGSF